MSSILPKAFCSQIVGQDQLDEITSILANFPEHPHTEMADIIGESISRKGSTEKLKPIDCRQFPERLDARRLMRLPTSHSKYKLFTMNAIKQTTNPIGQSDASKKRKGWRHLGLRRDQKHSGSGLWLKEKNLNSAVLSMMPKTVLVGWLDSFGRRPVRLETRIDKKHVCGTCAIKPPT